jgi:hypothetical protein
MYIRFYLIIVVHTDLHCIEEITRARRGLGGGVRGSILLRATVQAIILVQL